MLNERKHLVFLRVNQLTRSLKNNPTIIKNKSRIKNKNGLVLAFILSQKNSTFWFSIILSTKISTSFSRAHAK